MVTQAQVADDILRVASELGIEPDTVSVRVYLREGKYSYRTLRKLGGFNAIKSTFLKAIEPRDDAEIRDTAQVRSEISRLRRERGDIEALIRRIELAVADIKPIKIPRYVCGKKKRIHRNLQLTISDTHFGSDLDYRETGFKYGPVEESRAMAYIAKNTIDYKREYRDETSLTLNILGDIIENHLHPGGNGDALHIQTCRAINILSQFIGQLAANFPKVLVNFSVGNHGRDKGIHPVRATAMKYNAHETTIYYAIRKSFEKVPNITFNQPMTPWVEWKSFSHWNYGCHGDTNFSFGNPGGKVNVKAIENMVNRINSDRPASKKYKVFFCGHWHQAIVTQLSNGVWIVVNGALPTPSPYMQTMNIMTTQQNQVLLESTEEYPVGDIRFINASGSHKDPALDKIIQPWTGI